MSKLEFEKELLSFILNYRQKKKYNEKEGLNQVSEKTKIATNLINEIKRKFQEKYSLEFEVRISNFQIDFILEDKFNEKTAYEIKFSGNNISHEYYKDLVKILIYNKNHQSQPITRFVFISESKKLEAFRERIKNDLESIKFEFPFEKCFLGYNKL